MRWYKTEIMKIKEFVMLVLFFGSISGLFGIVMATILKWEYVKYLWIEGIYVVLTSVFLIMLTVSIFMWRRLK